jgi:hypothetical protein
MRIVVDTNVIVSTAIKANSLPFYSLANALRRLTFRKLAFCLNIPYNDRIH